MDGISTFPGPSPDHMMLLSPSDSVSLITKVKNWYSLVECVLSQSCSNCAVQVTAS